MGGKNIVLCSDGTGNIAIKGRGTNVFKLYEAIDIQGHTYDPRLTPQVAVYGDGIGTEGNVYIKWGTSAFAYGLTKNILDLYEELVRIYEMGDRIYMFGFSRGAYTIRALVGLIEYCGILDKKKMGNDGPLGFFVRRCWKNFRREAFKRMSESERGNNLSKVYTGAEERHRHGQFGAIIDDVYLPDGAVTIEFVGIWDTVVGITDVLNWVYPMRFCEGVLSNRLKRVCHALSIDDDRQSFHPELWNESGCTTKVDQVWFAGAHSNVGGGYVKHGMSLVALDWMMVEAEECGLRFIPADRDYVRSRKYVHDKLHNARAGLGIYYRYEPRNIANLCRQNNVGLPKIHVSVFERIAECTGQYAPLNLPYQFEVVQTNDKRSLLPSETLRAIEKQMAYVEETGAGQERNEPLLVRMRGAIQSGKMAYYALVVISISAIAALYAGRLFPQTVEAICRWCPFPDLVFSQICVFLIGAVWMWSDNVRRRIEVFAQKYWQGHRGALQEILRNAQKQRLSELADEAVVREHDTNSR